MLMLGNHGKCRTMPLLVWMMKGMANPSHITQFLKNGFTSDPSSSSWIMATGSWVIGKTSRSRSIHCLRRITMIVIMARCRDNASGTHRTMGGNQRPQGTPPGTPS